MSVYNNLQHFCLDIALKFPFFNIRSVAGLNQKILCFKRPKTTQMALKFVLLFLWNFLKLFMVFLVYQNNFWEAFSF